MKSCPVYLVAEHHQLHTQLNANHFIIWRARINVVKGSIRWRFCALKFCHVYIIKIIPVRIASDSASQTEALLCSEVAEISESTKKASTIRMAIYFKSTKDCLNVLNCEFA